MDYPSSLTASHTRAERDILGLRDPRHNQQEHILRKQEKAPPVDPFTGEDPEMIGFPH